MPQPDPNPNPPLTVRTFRQKGMGYFATPVSIIAKIDGVKVFEGEVPTVNEPYPILPQIGVPFGVPVFTWDEPLTKTSGQIFLEIAVTHGTLLVADTESNASQAKPAAPNPDMVPIITEYDFHRLIYWQYIDTIWHSDPLTNVMIDGVPQSRPTTAHPADVDLGQWYWRVDAGQVFTATINVQIPPTPRPVGAPA